MDRNIRGAAVGVAAVVMIIAVVLVAMPPSAPANAQRGPTTHPSVAEVTAGPRKPSASPMPDPTPTRPTPSVPAASPTSPPGPTPTPIYLDPTRTATFDSHLFEYRVRHPLLWVPHASEAPQQADRIEGSGYTWSGIARFVDPATSLARYVRAHPLQRLVDGRCVVEQADGTKVRGAAVGSIDWRSTRIDGHRALARQACGYVDAVVIVGDRAFTFTLQRNAVKGDRTLFGTIAKTIVLPRRYVSDTYAYRMMLPPPWKATPATHAGGADRFDGPRSQQLFVVVRSYLGGDPVAWANQRIAPRAPGPAGRSGCWWKSGVIWTGASDPVFKPADVAGRPAAIRSSCGFVDAAIPVGDRVYVMSLDSRRHTPGGDMAMFAKLTQELTFGVR